MARLPDVTDSADMQLLTLRTSLHRWAQRPRRAFGAYGGFESLVLETEACGRGGESWVAAVRHCLRARRRTAPHRP